MDFSFNSVDSLNPVDGSIFFPAVRALEDDEYDELEDDYSEIVDPTVPVTSLVLPKRLRLVTSSASGSVVGNPEMARDQSEEPQGWDGSDLGNDKGAKGPVKVEEAEERIEDEYGEEEIEEEDEEEGEEGEEEDKEDEDEDEIVVEKPQPAKLAARKPGRPRKSTGELNLDDLST